MSRSFAPLFSGRKDKICCDNAFLRIFANIFGDNFGIASANNRQQQEIALFANIQIEEKITK